MFPGASQLGDSIDKLFSTDQGYIQQLYAENRQLKADRSSTAIQNQGVRDMPSTNANYASQNNPQYGNEKNRAAATEDPLATEERWQARLAKYAGIAQATGVKL